MLQEICNFHCLVINSEKLDFFNPAAVDCANPDPFPISYTRTLEAIEGECSDNSEKIMDGIIGIVIYLKKKRVNSSSPPL